MPRFPAGEAEPRSGESRPTARRLPGPRPQSILEGMQPLTEAQIRAMTVEERLQLIETVWDSLDPADVPLADEQRAELDRRLDDPNPGPLIPWEQVRSELDGG